MLGTCTNNLSELNTLLLKLEPEQYTQKLRLLSDCSIGQHVRHILEFYICLLQGIEAGLINYDERERNTDIETCPVFASSTITSVCDRISAMTKDSNLILRGVNYSTESGYCDIHTTSDREFAYCLEHSIHHQALIRVGLLEMNLEHLVDHQFGVAPSTIKFRETGHGVKESV